MRNLIDTVPKAKFLVIVIVIRIAAGITSYSGAKLAISFLRSELQKSAGVPRSIELFCRSDRRKMMVRFDAKIGRYFGRDPYLKILDLFNNAGYQHKFKNGTEFDSAKDTLTAV